MSNSLWKPAQKLLQTKKKQRILVTDYDKQRFQGFIREIQQQDQADVIKLSTVNGYGIYLPPSPSDSNNDSWFEPEYSDFPTPDKLTPPPINGNRRSFYTPSSMTI
jgi:hypothetical protein